MGKIIGVISLKGGVGKTSSVVALGSALAGFGKKVLLVDANLSAPNLGVHLNFINPKKTIHHVLMEKSSIYDAIHKHKNLFVIPAQVYPKKDYDPYKLKEKLEEVREDYDFILIDSSPALNDETLATMKAADELFVVSTPDYSTLTMTLKAIKVAKDEGAPITGIILNKVFNKGFEVPLEKMEYASNIPVLAVIPHSVFVLKSQANFISPVEFNPKSDLAYEYKKLAACLSKIKYDPFRMKNVLKGRFPRKQQVNRDLFYTRVFD